MQRENILIIDDEIIIRKLLREILTDYYEILEAENGLNALEVMGKNTVDLILVDINMPVMNGLDFIHHSMKQYPDAAYIIISGNRDIKTAIDALHSGVWAFIQKPFTDVQNVLKVITDSMERRKLLIENRRYKEHLEEMVRNRTFELEVKNEELRHSRNRIIGILSRAAEFKDFETGRHFIRVSRYSAVIAEALSMKKEEALIIQQAAPVHDIGKIGIPESILLKKGKLDVPEIEAMRQHCNFGEDILKSQSLEDLESVLAASITIPPTPPEDLLTVAANIAKNHHERIDGSGYPSGLRGEEIPIEARIVAVADVYDALGSKRPYKEAWPERQCQEFLQQNTDKLFDKAIVEAFLGNIDKIMRIKQDLTDKLIVHQNPRPLFPERPVGEFLEKSPFPQVKESPFSGQSGNWYFNRSSP